MVLYLYQFNNYYNRFVKKFDTLGEYGNPLAEFPGVNFIPNDGIQTKQIINYDGIMPDYLIAADDVGNIISRWFVIESYRVRQGQYNLILYRDVIADWYEDVINAPCFIEKASLTRDNPLIYNKEDMSFNQIKTSEYLLKDRSNCAWIVGYVDKAFTKEVSVEPVESAADYTYSTYDEFLANYPYSTYLGTQKVNTGRTQVYRFNFYNTSEGNKSYCFAWNYYGEAQTPYVSSPITGQYYSNSTGVYEKPDGAKGIGYQMGINQSQFYQVGANALKKVKEQDWFININSYTNVLPRAIYNELAAQAGKKVKIGSDLYQLGLTAGSEGSSITTIPTGSALANQMEPLKTYFNLSTATQPVYELEVPYRDYFFTLNQIAGESLTANITATRLHSRFSPYDIFCIPYGEVPVGSGATTSAEYALKFANAIMGTTQVYDVQLLPYCPLQERIGVNGEVLLNAANGDLTLSHGGVTYSALYWVDNPNFEVNIDYTIPMPQAAIDIKLANDCDIYRLCSPNYNGQFEFSPVRNSGVYGFTVDCSYKPYTPYIKISPIFGGLYGKDFDDARGLICGGDFSLTQITDKWAEFQVQNKNYQVMFDRDIQSLDITQAAQRKLQKWEIATGAIQGATSGALMGLMTGNPITAVGVGAMGAGASILGGAADYRMQETLREEARDYKIDQFGYQLGNIQALPLNLTKVSALNKNNKLFPFIEYYTCTAIEREALRDKIKYNGMTVMAIGTLAQHIQTEPTYIKGRLIRLETIDTDYHIVNNIADELNKGVFI